MVATVRVSQDEDADFNRALLIDGTCFGSPHSPERALDLRPRLEMDRSTFAMDGDTEVGFASSYTMELTLPGGAQVPVGGLTWVGVLPTHRRRGHMRALVEDQLRQTRERGEVASLLTASEGGIYGRFGYGVATRYGVWKIDRRAAAVRSDAPTEGRVRMVLEGGATVADACAHVFDQMRRSIPGELTHPRGHWRIWGDDPEWARDGASPRFVAVHENGAGVVDGFVSYRLKRVTAPYDWHDLQVSELVGLTAAARADLWRFLLGVDLVHQIRLTSTPDDALPLLLQNRRAAEGFDVADWLWACVLDVPAAFGARTYRGTDTLILDVGRTGRYVLEVRDGMGTCTATDAPPDLSLTLEALGMIWLGGTSAQSLASAGLVAEATPGASSRLDDVALTSRTPVCSVRF